MAYRDPRMQRVLLRAKSRALARLAEQHPAEYAGYLDAEMLAEGFVRVPRGQRERGGWKPASTPPPRLTRAAERLLARVRTDGPRRFNYRDAPQIKQLELAGLVTADWDADLDQSKGRLRWRILVTAVPVSG